MGRKKDIDKREVEIPYSVDYENLTPSYLRKLADELERDGLTKLSFEVECDDYDDIGYIVPKVTRLETDAEVIQRVNHIREMRKKYRKLK
jgi:hypothetical protein